MFSFRGCDVEGLQSKALLAKGNYKTRHVFGRVVIKIISETNKNFR